MALGFVSTALPGTSLDALSAVVTGHLMKATRLARIALPFHGRRPAGSDPSTASTQPTSEIDGRINRRDL